MKILGVDPGIHGGLAIVEMVETGPRLLDAIDVPVSGSGAKERVDAIALQEWLLQHGPHMAFIERAQAMPKQGASSGFKYGRSVGSIEAVIAANTIPMELIEPSVWKRALRLPGKDKEAARQLALQRFPGKHHLFARRKDHGRAEAALICLVGLLRLESGGHVEPAVTLPGAPAPAGRGDQFRADTNTDPADSSNLTPAGGVE
jgi:crossover junction endodeoxyribonuclease RuvC